MRQNKTAILFVDDEPNILLGIKRMLRSMRNEFDFHFSESGKEALALLEENDISIVVSDMRMPGMNGAEFLSEVQNRFPQVIRIMLTGQADNESVFRSIAVVHQFLTKPCEPEKLKNILIRSTALHNLISDVRLRQVISKVGSLPSLPSVYARLQDVLQNPDAVADDVADVIEQDISMTAKLLQLLNSSFFGLYQKVDSPARAVKLLGLDTIKILVLGMQIFEELKIPSLQISLESLWRHSLAVAHCSKLITLQETSDKDMVNESYMAGMLHDIGKLLLLSRYGDGYIPAVEQARNECCSLTASELKVLQATHADVGAYLMGLWGFNGNIIEAIAFHNSLEDYPATDFNSALAVHVADYCYYQIFPDEAIGAAPVLNMEYLEKNGFSENIEKWQEGAGSYLESCQDEY